MARCVRAGIPSGEINFATFVPKNGWQVHVGSFEISDIFVAYRRQFPVIMGPPMSSKPPRRVIPIKVEPPSSLSASQRAAVLAACTRLKSLPGALLPIFHAVQEALGHVPKDAVPLIALSLNLSR